MFFSLLKEKAGMILLLSARHSSPLVFKSPISLIFMSLIIFGKKAWEKRSLKDWAISMTKSYSTYRFFKVIKIFDGDPLDKFRIPNIQNWGVTIIKDKVPMRVRRWRLSEQIIW